MADFHDKATEHAPESVSDMLIVGLLALCMLTFVFILGIF
jgi:hypothetical protein